VPESSSAMSIGPGSTAGDADPIADPEPRFPIVSELMPQVRTVVPPSSPFETDSTPLPSSTRSEGPRSLLQSTVDSTSGVWEEISRRLATVEERPLKVRPSSSELTASVTLSLSRAHESLTGRAPRIEIQVPSSPILPEPVRPDQGAVIDTSTGTIEASLVLEPSFPVVRASTISRSHVIDASAPATSPASFGSEEVEHTIEEALPRTDDVKTDLGPVTEPRPFGPPDSTDETSNEEPHQGALSSHGARAEERASDVQVAPGPDPHAAREEPSRSALRGLLGGLRRASRGRSRASAPSPSGPQPSERKLPPPPDPLPPPPSQLPPPPRNAG
jgi:hypothetical protein